MLAGLSVDYVVRLEQGRADRPSAQVVSALARVLQLSDLERNQLYTAAGLAVPQASTVPRLIPGSVQRLLARLPDVAIGVYTAHWTLLTANAAWEALLGPVERDYNLIVRQFTGTAPPVITHPAVIDAFEHALVSDLRAALLRYPDDGTVQRVLGQLETIPRFARIWAEGVVVDHHSNRKTFAHPLVGLTTLDCDVFTASGTDLHIVTYTAAPETEDASRFDLIRALGAQQDISTTS